MKFGVVTFPGSNCDDDMIYTLQSVMQQQVVRIWHKDTDLQNVDGIFLPGGFSYGDYLRSGAIAKFSPIMNKIADFAASGGFIFGVCNGFQILCETGLLPGALLHNDNHKFICKNTFIKSVNTELAVTNACPNTPIKIPIAHGEGKYFASEKVLNELEKNNQILFKYCSKSGEINIDGNPNGSLNNIAGICNKQKNVFGMMPHPERAADENLLNTDGKFIFDSITHFFQQKVNQ